VLYSVRQGSASENRALPIQSDLFYFTHYATYEVAPGEMPAGVPNQLLQARKAVELASNSGLLANERVAGRTGLKEEDYTREALTQAKSFLARAEETYAKNPKDQEVVQFARTAAQSAENARALAMGAVGGLVIRQLENELAGLRKELARAKGTPLAVASDSVFVSSSPATSSGPHEPDPDPTPTIGIEPTPAPPLVKQPALWFAVTGWTLALVLLFRRRSI